MLANAFVSQCQQFAFSTVFHKHDTYIPLMTIYQWTLFSCSLKPLIAFLSDYWKMIYVSQTLYLKDPLVQIRIASNLERICNIQPLWSRSAEPRLQFDVLQKFKIRSLTYLSNLIFANIRVDVLLDMAWHAPNGPVIAFFERIIPPNDFVISVDASCE